MASFTDPILKQREYVQQLPIEAMTQVGMQKQAQYDQGLQKIQSHVEQIAGMDVVRDVDKNYLQSKLNEVGSRLTAVAAGDFSNYQLLNSVGGMITSVAKDKNIQNAVSSTQRVRKSQQDMETAKKAGKSSPENEWFFNDQLNDYLSDSNVETSYNGQYIEYTDVGKKLRDVVEKIKEIDNSIDIPYQRNSDGSPRLDEKGNPIIDEAMLTIKTKGKSAERILSNFYSSLDEKDKQQLYITSNYHYKDANKETFRKDIVENYENKKQFLSESLTDLNTRLKTDPNLTAAQKSSIEAKIKENSELLNGKQLDTDLENELSSLDNIKNLEEFKYKIYTQKYLDGLAKDMSYESYQQEIKNNPYAQMRMEKMKLQYNYDNMNRQQRNWEKEFDLKGREFEFEKASFAMKALKEGGGNQPLTVPNSLPTETDTPSLTKLEAEIEGYDVDLKKLDAMYAPLIAGDNTPEGKKQELDNLYNNYLENPSQMINSLNDPNLAEYLEQRRAVDMVKTQKQQLRNSTLEASGDLEKQMDAVLSQLPSYNHSDGRTYTGKQLFDMAKHYTSLPDSEKAKVLTNTESRTLILKATSVFRENYNSLRDVIGERSKFQSDYLAKRMPERQRMEGALNLEDKNIAHSVNSVLSSKMNTSATEGALDTPGKEKPDMDAIAALYQKKGTGIVLSKGYDGGGDLILVNGTERQSLPLSPSEFKTFFPNYSENNPMQNIKDAILVSPAHTTNSMNRKDSSGAVSAYISGYSIPGLAKTAIAPLVKIDVEGSPNNNGSANDKFAIRMYVNENGVWKTNIITPTFKNHEETMQIISNIGTSTVSEFLKKNK